MQQLEKPIQKPYSLEDWRKGYESQKQELEYWIEDIEGEIPQELSGTLYRNGPGFLDVYGTPLQHPFDGDGMITAFTFNEGKCFFVIDSLKPKNF